VAQFFIPKSILVRLLSAGHLPPGLTYRLLPDVFDGAMIVLAVFVLNFIHPGWFLSGATNPHGTMSGEKDSQIPASSRIHER